MKSLKCTVIFAPLSQYIQELSFLAEITRTSYYGSVVFGAPAKNRGRQLWRPYGGRAAKLFSTGAGGATPPLQETADANYGVPTAMPRIPCSLFPKFRLFLEIRPQDLTIRAGPCIIEVYIDLRLSVATAAVPRRGALSWRNRAKDSLRC